MADRMILVPESLIEALLDDFGNGRARAKTEARALLSQSTTSAEHETWCASTFPGAPEDQCSCRLPATPPSIIDMAPGTTFTGEAGIGWPPSEWTVGERREGTKYVTRKSDGWVLDPNSIAPSTIRDVREPEGGPHA